MIKRSRFVLGNFVEERNNCSKYVAFYGNIPELLDKQVEGHNIFYYIVDSLHSRNILDNSRKVLNCGAHINMASIDFEIGEYWDDDTVADLIDEVLDKYLVKTTNYVFNLKS